MILNIFNIYGILNDNCIAKVIVMEGVLVVYWLKRRTAES